MKAVDWIELANYSFRRIHPVVAYHIKIDINAVVNQNRFYYSCQYMLHVSAVLNIFRHFNACYLQLSITFYILLTVHLAVILGK